MNDELPCLDLLAATPAIRRGLNLERLRGLPAETGARKARHLAAGEITLSQMLREWALQNLGHVRQISELVRARKYLAGTGSKPDRVVGLRRDSDHRPGGQRTCVSSRRDK